jgi:hypothetical protein
VSSAASVRAQMAQLLLARREQAQRLAANDDFAELTTEKAISSRFARGFLMEQAGQ